jgi:hypothetical protein
LKFPFPISRVSHSLLTMFFWRSKFRKATELAETGKLNEAAGLFWNGQLYEFNGGSELAARLAAQLMARAQTRASAAEFLGAWQDLNQADRLLEVTNSIYPQQLLRQRQQLLELAIEAAESHLAAGRPVQAQRIIADVKRQRILDSRADQIESLANRIHQADMLAAQGQWSGAQQALESVVAQRPDLAWVQARKQAFAQQLVTAGGLKNQLQSAMQESQWTTAQQVSAQLLDFAPHYQVAADALRRSWERQQPRTDQPPPRRDPALNDTSARKLSETDANLVKAARTNMNRMMLWVDGVGGFLLCVDPQVTVGRALPDAGVEIPVLGDLHRRHLRIARSGGDYIATALAEATSNGQRLAAPQLLQNGQQVTLGNTVKLRFRLPSALSASARLDVISRHRTQPWADAVILVADTIILGPRADSHVVCPEMDGDLILCRGPSGWSAQFNGNIDVDGKVFENKAELSDHCRIIGDGFSMTLERA